MLRFIAVCFSAYQCSDVRFSDCKCSVWVCRATPRATCPWTNQGWMPCSGYGPPRGAVLPGARPGLARTPWAAAVVTALDESEVQRYTATPSSMLAMGATISGGGKHKKAKASAATAAAAPPAMAPSPFVQPSVVQAIQGVQQVCSSSTVVSAGSTVRLNRLHRLQPCTFERHLPTH